MLKSPRTYPCGLLQGAVTGASVRHFVARGSRVSLTTCWPQALGVIGVQREELLHALSAQALLAKARPSLLFCTWCSCLLLARTRRPVVGGCMLPAEAGIRAPREHSHTISHISPRQSHAAPTPYGVCHRRRIVWQRHRSRSMVCVPGGGATLSLTSS